MEFAVLMQAAHNGDMNARDTLVKENIGLVRSIAGRFRGRGCEQEDLFQIGSIGLMKAIDRFDESMGLAFSTYAFPLIAGEIKRFLRDDGMVKVGRSLKEKGCKLRHARAQLENELGREATMSELCAVTSMSMEDLFMVMDANSGVESLSQPVCFGDDGKLSLMDTVGTEYDENEKLIDRIFVEQLLSGLNEDEKRLIRMRYFENMTQQQTAQKLGISQVQVSRLEKKILMRIRSRAVS